MMTTAPGTFWLPIASSTASPMEDSSPTHGAASLESASLASVWEGPGTEGCTATAGTLGARPTQAKPARVNAPNASSSRFISSGCFGVSESLQAKMENLQEEGKTGRCP